MIEQIRELFQNLIAPQLEGIKGDIRALDAKFDANLEPSMGSSEHSMQSFKLLGRRSTESIPKLKAIGANYLPRFAESKRYFPQILCGWKTRWISAWAA